MHHRNCTTCLQKELDFLKLLVIRFHEQEKVNGLELDVALLKTQEIYEQLLRMKIAAPEAVTSGEKTVTLTPVEVPAVVVAGTIAAEKKQPAQPVVEPVKAGILAEKISPPDFHPINETLAQQKPGNDLSSKLQTAPLSSMVAGIGLNDKFLYIRELFKGDSALYSNTVQYLDTAESLGDAMDFVHRHFDWDKKNETVQKFINLVHRRHGS